MSLDAETLCGGTPDDWEPPPLARVLVREPGEVSWLAYAAADDEEHLEAVLSTLWAEHPDWEVRIDYDHGNHDG